MVFVAVESALAFTSSSMPFLLQRSSLAPARRFVVFMSASELMTQGVRANGVADACVCAC